jgi:hypothetical protein
MNGERGQTQQDFAVGVSVFLLAMIFVFAYLPTTLAVGDAAVEQGSYTADRLSGAIYGNVSDADDAGQLNVTRTREFFTAHDNSAALRANYSLASTTNANVTLETLGGVVVDVGGEPAAAGDVYAEQVGATATRIVRLGSTRYRLVVRVW